MLVAALVSLYVLGALSFLCAITLAGSTSGRSPRWVAITVCTAIWPLAMIAVFFIVLAKVSLK